MTVDRAATAEIVAFAAGIKRNADTLREMSATASHALAQDAVGLAEMMSALGALEHATICLIGQVNRLEARR